MPEYVINRTMHALNEHGKSLKGSRVLLVGLAYKKNVDDDRESPTYILWKSLLNHGAEVFYYDPYCPVVGPTREHADLAGNASVTWEDIEEGSYDVAIISTAHANVDHDKIVEVLPLVIDTRGICKHGENVVKA